MQKLCNVSGIHYYAWKCKILQIIHKLLKFCKCLKLRRLLSTTTLLMIMLNINMQIVMSVYLMEKVWFKVVLFIVIIHQQSWCVGNHSHEHSYQQSTFKQGDSNQVEGTRGVGLRLSVSNIAVVLSPQIVVFFIANSSSAMCSTSAYERPKSAMVDMIVLFSQCQRHCVTQSLQASFKFWRERMDDPFKMHFALHNLHGINLDALARRKLLQAY